MSKKKSKNRNQFRHQNNPNGQVNNQQFQHVNKSNRKIDKKKKPFIRPSLINVLDTDVEFETQATSNGAMNGDDQIPHNSFNENGHHDNNNNNRNGKKNKRNKKKNKQNALNEIKNSGLVTISKSTRFSIGELDDSAPKCLLPSQPYCKLKQTPDGVFEQIVSYVQRYFECFDTNRDNLLGAYSDKCTFSLSINLNNAVAHRSFRFDDQLFKTNRNLKKYNDYQEQKRLKLLHLGHIEIVSILRQMPATEHDPNSFKFDVLYYSPHMISFSLKGVFKELRPNENVVPMRSFSRVFILHIKDNQEKIVNEQLVLSNITTDQYKLYYEQRVKEAANQRLETQQAANGAVTEPIKENAEFLQNLTEQQCLMVKEFSSKSSLTIEWSRQCLEHSQWNFDQAANLFIQYKDSIPKHAFIVP